MASLQWPPIDSDEDYYTEAQRQQAEARTSELSFLYTSLTTVEQLFKRFVAGRPQIGTEQRNEFTVIMQALRAEAERWAEEKSKMC